MNRVTMGPTLARGGSSVPDYRSVTLSGKGYGPVTLTAKPYHRWANWPVLTYLHYFHTASQVRFKLEADKTGMWTIYKRVGGGESSVVARITANHAQQSMVVQDRLIIPGHVNYFVGDPINALDSDPTDAPVLVFDALPHEEYYRRYVRIFGYLVSAAIGGLIAWAVITLRNG